MGTRHVLRSTRVVHLGVVLAGLVVAGCQGNSTPAPSGKQPSHDEIATPRTVSALDSPTEIDCVQAPIRDVIESLEIRHDVRIKLDAKALAEAGVNDDLPITYKVKGISLKAALTAMLQNYGLTHVIDHGVVLITTAARAKAAIQ
jgi:hypothetical protein